MLGIFDSGVGGLTIVKELERKIPEVGFVYFGDTARVPWGSKSAQTVQQYSEQITRFLIDKGVSEIIIACNTASAVAGDYLKRKFPKIKFYDVIKPAVRKVAGKSDEQTKRVLVIGTRATIRSEAYCRRLTNSGLNLSINCQACPLFVPLAEEKIKNKKIVYAIIEKYLGTYRGKVDLLVLGCTHYPLLAEHLRGYFGEKVELISSSEEVIKSLQELNFQQGEKEFYFSDWNDSYQALAGEILNAEITVHTCSM